MKLFKIDAENCLVTSLSRKYLAISFLIVHCFNLKVFPQSCDYVESPSTLSAVNLDGMILDRCIISCLNLLQM